MAYKTHRSPGSVVGGVTGRRSGAVPERSFLELPEVPAERCCCEKHWWDERVT